MIAVGGGGIVRDMIQRAHNMGLGINLMNGPEGASTDKATIMPEYAFEEAKGLIEKLYNKHPDIFVKDFDIKKLDKNIENARGEQRMATHINDLRTRISKDKVIPKKTYVKPKMFVKEYE